MLKNTKHSEDRFKQNLTHVENAVTMHYIKLCLKQLILLFPGH